jgi:hypothetical protein
LRPGADVEVAHYLAELIDGAVRAELGRFKASVVDTEFDKLDLKIRTQRSTSRMVSMTAYEAGGAAGASLAINPGLGEAQSRTAPKGS